MTGARHLEQDVIILGAGGTGGDVLDWFAELAAQGLGYCPKGFLDDDERKWGTEVRSLPVLGPLGSALSILPPGLSTRSAALPTLPAVRTSLGHP